MLEWFYKWVARRSLLYQREVARREEVEGEADQLFEDKKNAEANYEAATSRIDEAEALTRVTKRELKLTRRRVTELAEQSQKELRDVRLTLVKSERQRKSLEERVIYLEETSFDKSVIKDIITEETMDQIPAVFITREGKAEYLNSGLLKVFERGFGNELRARRYLEEIRSDPQWASIPFYDRREKPEEIGTLYFNVPHLVDRSIGVGKYLGMLKAIIFKPKSSGQNLEPGIESI